MYRIEITIQEKGTFTIESSGNAELLADHGDDVASMLDKQIEAVKFAVAESRKRSKSTMQRIMRWLAL